MLKKFTKKDIDDEMCEKVINCFYNNYHALIEKYIIHEVIAYYFTNYFYWNIMWKATFLQYYNSVSYMFNLIGENYEKTKKKHKIPSLNLN